MGFPIPYAGVLPKLLFTAAISIAALKDLCSSLLELLGLSSYNYRMASSSHGHNFLSQALFHHDQPQPQPHQHHHHHHHHPEHINYDWYFNSHLHTPSADPRLLLRRTAFSAALQASLPVLRYGSLSLIKPASSVSQLLSSSLQSSPSSSPVSSSVSSSQVQMQQLLHANEQHSSAMLCSPSAPSASSPTPASLCASHTLPFSSSSPSSSQSSSPPSSQSSPPSSPSSSSSSSPSSSQSKLEEFSASVAPHLSEHHETDVVRPLTPQTRSCAAPSIHINTTECAVCLCEFQTEQEVRKLPVCNHVFHKDCIDGWILHNHQTCPICRASLLTPTMALQEMLREQESLSHQLTAWFTYIQEEEDAYYTHHHHHHHQAFYFPLQQPAGY